MDGHVCGLRPAGRALDGDAARSGHQQGDQVLPVGHLQRLDDLFRVARLIILEQSTLQGLAKSLAADYASFGVTVNCVMPSMMETKFLADTSDLIVQASAEANPMKRNARVEDVVPAMAFLLSEEAGFITGVTLPVTGGSAFL